VQGDRLVFQTSSGRSPGRRNCLRALQAQAEYLGVEGRDGQPLGLHDLRHSLASTLRGLGWADERIAPILRHSNSRTPSAMYGGLSSDSLAAIREQAAAALA
jgi:integrase